MALQVAPRFEESDFQSLREVPILNDREDFYFVGRLYREGDIVAADDKKYLKAAQQRFTGTTTSMRRWRSTSMRC